MENNYQNITDNSDNYGSAIVISWGLMIPSFVAYALLTWCYFEEPEMLTKLFKNRRVASGGAGRAHASTVLGRTVNPISTRGSRLSPLQYYEPSRIFRPCDGPA